MRLADSRGSGGGRLADAARARTAAARSLGIQQRRYCQKLWVTEQTVKFRLSTVYRKLDVGNHTEASRYAQVNGPVGKSQPAEVS